MGNNIIGCNPACICEATGKCKEGCSRCGSARSNDDNPEDKPALKVI